MGALRKIPHLCGCTHFCFCAKLGLEFMNPRCLFFTAIVPQMLAFTPILRLTVHWLLSSLNDICIWGKKYGSWVFESTLPHRLSIYHFSFFGMLLYYWLFSARKIHSRNVQVFFFNILWVRSLAYRGMLLLILIGLLPLLAYFCTVRHPCVHD